MRKIKRFIKNAFETIGILAAIGGIFTVVAGYFLFPFIVLGVIIWIVLRIT